MPPVNPGKKAPTSGEKRSKKDPTSGEKRSKKAPTSGEKRSKKAPTSRKSSKKSLQTIKKDPIRRKTYHKGPTWRKSSNNVSHIAKKNVFVLPGGGRALTPAPPAGVHAKIMFCCLFCGVIQETGY